MLTIRRDLVEHARVDHPDEARDVMAVISDLESNHVGVTERIVDGDEPHRFVTVDVNGREWS